MIKNKPEICLNKHEGTEFFDEIIIGRYTRISFHRTLRIPEDGEDYPLPAGLGRFPIHRVEDYAEKVPSEWLTEGGFFIPLYQKEALFIEFEGPCWHPTIAKVCVGKINAITGKPYNENLSKNNQDYIVIPTQRWMDGICSGENVVRQFVAMPLGKGYTIEAQLTDEEIFGGIQVMVMDAKAGIFTDRNQDLDMSIEAEEEARKRKKSGKHYNTDTDHDPGIRYSPKFPLMGIAAGGNIKQQIYKDKYGIESWNIATAKCIKLHLVNSLDYKSITGYEPPQSPVSSNDYQEAGIPWFSYYNEEIPSVKPASIFKRILGITQIDKKRGLHEINPEINKSISAYKIKEIRTPDINELSNEFRERAKQSGVMKKWEYALEKISYVIDLDHNVTANDFSLRSCCNYHLGRFVEGNIDSTQALKIDKKCINAYRWRARCRESLGDYEGVVEDAKQLIKNKKTAVLGLKMHVEASMKIGRYMDAVYNAVILHEQFPDDPRAKTILDEARKAFRENKK